MFKKSKTPKGPEVAQTYAERAACHLRKAENLVRIGGVGNDQMIRVAVQATARATLALAYLSAPDQSAYIDGSVPVTGDEDVDEVAVG